MRLRVVKKNGLRTAGVRAACGDEIVVPDDLGATLVASGECVPVADPVSDAPPLEAAIKNGAAKKWSKKG